MVDFIQDFRSDFPISNPETGLITPEFLRFLQQRGSNLTNTNVTVEEAIATLDTKADKVTQVIAGTGLNGGGTLASDITLSADEQEILDQITTTQGSVLFRGVSDWQGLAPGTAGQVLQTNGTGANPSWVTPSSGGGGSSYEAGVTTKPVLSSFSWVNQGTSTGADATNAFRIAPQLDLNWHMLVQTAPTAPYDVYMRFEDQSFSTSAITSQLISQTGLILRNSGTGRFLTFLSMQQRIATSGQINYQVSLDRYNDPTSFSATTNTVRNTAPYKWLRINLTGSTITLYLSPDGWNWHAIGTEALGTFITSVDQIGFGCRAFSNNSLVNIHVYQFGTSAPV